MDVIAMLAIYYGVSIADIRLLSIELDEDDVTVQASAGGALVKGTIPHSHCSGQTLTLNGDGQHEVQPPTIH